MVASTLMSQTNSRNLIMKLGGEGFIAYETETDGFVNRQHFPALSINPVDVSGAGDTVISVASLLLSAGINYNDLSKISALAGGLVCEKVGVVPIDKETLLEETKKTYK